MRAKPNCSLTKQTEDKLIEMIKHNNLKPGDRLPTENELSRELQVGRSTLREAVKSLCSRNILETKQGSGIFVSQKQGVPEDPLGFSLLEENEEKLALDLNSVRLMIEPEMASLAAQNATDEQRILIMRQCEKVEELIQRNADYYTEDMKFHRCIAEASGNVVTTQLIPILHYAIGQNIKVTDNRLVGDTMIWHRRIAVAIKRGDCTSARNAMMVHIEINRREMAENLNNAK